MKKILVILLWFFIFTSFTFASFTIVDMENEYSSLNWVDTIEGAYSDISTWFIWNNFDNFDDWEIEYSIATWYLWNNYVQVSKNELKNTFFVWNFWNNYVEILYNERKNIFPVWYFGSYSWTILDFWLIDNENVEEITCKENKINNSSSWTLTKTSSWNFNETTFLSYSWTVSSSSTWTVSSSSKTIASSNSTVIIPSNSYTTWSTSSTTKSSSSWGGSSSYNKYISIRDFFEELYWINMKTQDIYNKYYYLLYEKNLNSSLDYTLLSWILVSKYWNIVIDDNNLSFDLFVKLWIFSENLKRNSKVKKSYLSNIIKKVQLNKSFKQDIKDNIDDVFSLDKKYAFDDFIKNYYINKELNSLSDKNKEKLLACVNFESCVDYNYYYDFLDKINKKIDSFEYKKLWIEIDDNKELNWFEYSDVILRIIAKEWLYKWKHSLSEYSEFINIINEAIFYWEQIKSNEVSYFTYKGLNVELLTNKKLFNSIERLSNTFFDKVVDIYRKIQNKEKLLFVLRDYLSKY